MSVAQNIPGRAQTDTPSGFVCAAPWATVDRALYVDVKAYLGSVRYNRNVLSTRFAAKCENNIVTDQTFILGQVEKNMAFSTFEFKAHAKNVMTVVSANRPVHLVLVRADGELDLGLQTMFVISSSIVALRFSNTENLGNAEVNLIVV
jgi:hypothetical protein